MSLMFGTSLGFASFFIRWDVKRRVRNGEEEHAEEGRERSGRIEGRRFLGLSKMNAAAKSMLALGSRLRPSEEYARYRRQDDRAISESEKAGENRFTVCLAADGCLGFDPSAFQRDEQR